MISIIEAGSVYKQENKYVFSRIAKYNPADFLRSAIAKFGLPPTFNQEGQFYISKENNFTSLYLARSVSEVFDTIINGKRKCSLKESCIFANSIQENKINVTDFCENAPWENYSNDLNRKLCGYCQVWKTFGLSRMKILEPILKRTC